MIVQHKNDLKNKPNTEISTEPGTIYFIRERNLITNEISPFVKIGMTALHRKTTERKNDLQTGNPRELFVSHEVKVPCVRAVETALRYRFLAQNVYLEWHVFLENSKDQFSDALTYCELLGEQFDEITHLLNKAEILGYSPSLNESLPKTEEAKYWCRQYLIHHELTKMGETVLTAQRVRAKEYFRDGKQIPEGISITERSVSAVDWDKFRETYPEVFDEYTSQRHTGLFKVLAKLSKVEVSENPEISEFQVEVESFFRMFEEENDYTDPSPEFRQLRIKILQKTKFSAVEKEIARCQLKAICGLAAGIENCCSWVRGLAKPRLDSARLAHEKKALLSPFTTNRKLVAATITRSAGRRAENSETSN